jgi:nucleotide-binding universal stress UspA family protein
VDVDHGLEEAKRMQTEPPRRGPVRGSLHEDVDIVVGIDGSADAERALRWAVEEACLRGGRVRAVLVWTAAGPPREPSRPPPATSPEHPRWVAECLLRDVVERVRADVPEARILEQIVFGPPVQRLLAASDEAALLVLGAHGTSRTRRMMTGSVSLACVYGASIPVVVIRGERTPDRQAPIVVGVDGSTASVDALSWAADEAELRQVSLRVLHAWNPVPATVAGRLSLADEVFRDTAQSLLDRAVNARVSGRGRLEVETTLIVGNATHGLINASAGAQLLVLGARGGGGFAELLLGSTSSQCVQHAACPVAVVRGPAGTGPA